MSSCADRRTLSGLTLLAAIGMAAAPGVAQSPRAVTAADYARAEQFMSYRTTPLVTRAGVRPTWLPDDRFWYRVTTAEGSEFVLVDPARGVREPAFDHAKLAAALSAAAGGKFDGAHLPFTEIELPAGGQSVSFRVDGKAWKCDRAGNLCAAGDSPEAAAGGRGGRGGLGGRGDGAAAGVLSPDGMTAAFIRDYNLWVRDTATGKETQLTTGGVKDYGYATDNAGWTNSQRAILLWSPDSKKIATFQRDQRNVGEM